jgi:hypothetical protein
MHSTSRGLYSVFHMFISTVGGNIMRLSVMEKDESIFYNLGVFKEHEDLIVFNMHEFLDFYAEIGKRLLCIKNIIRDECPGDPLQAIKFLDPHLELLEVEVEELLDFDVQTTLESFNKTEETKTYETKSSPEKEEIQCLMGL